ncbi:NAD(P)H-dependent flavin oxidoreductase [Pleomorphochaeta sp. DL1XJH-081]|uniref:NAD(P)H-dependent flavin oxidoreductase n=1 Tax=Pleomorphochaeta sp. DL1XJH-081 TaxID=3409690 RepID=UPI003BB71B7D
MKEFTFENFQRLIASLKIKLPLFDLPRLTIGNKVASSAIVQGGMGVGISLSSLSSAVANQGGVGMIAANGIGMIEPDYFKDGRAANIRGLRNEIRKAKARSKGIIGVNIMVALQDFDELLKTSIEEKVDLVVLGAGLPIKNIPVKQLREAGIQVVPIVSSARAASLIFSMWKRIYNDVPDAVVVEGPMAGGHLGVAQKDLADEAFSLETVVPQVKETLASYIAEFGKSIPIIAGGGIFTGEDIYHIMKLGADAVQIGTRFAATDECDADIRFKQAIVDCAKEDIGIIKSPVGLPGRAIVNDFLTSTTEKKRNFKCPWQCLAGCQAEESNYCISMALNNARKGNLKSGFVFVGSNAHRITAIMSVGELFQELRQQYTAALFADKKSVFTEVAQLALRLKHEYKVTEQRAKELKDSYIQAIANGPIPETIASAKAEINSLHTHLGNIRRTVSDKLAEVFQEATQQALES